MQLSKDLAFVAVRYGFTLNEDGSFALLVASDNGTDKANPHVVRGDAFQRGRWSWDTNNENSILLQYGMRGTNSLHLELWEGTNPVFLFFTTS